MTIDLTVDLAAGAYPGSTARLVNDVQATSDQVSREVVWQVVVDLYEPAAVGDRVWNDVNGNGIQDAGEKGLAGAVVTITNLDGSPVVDAQGQPAPPITTDASGAYLFENLIPGTYRVSVTPPSGVVASPTNRGSDRTVDSNPATTSVSLAAGERNLSVDFGFFVEPDDPDTPDDPDIPGKPAEPDEPQQPIRHHAGASPRTMPRTGTDVRRPVAMALVLVLTGGAFVLGGRRRRRRAA